MINYKKKSWLILVTVFIAVASFTFLTQKFKDNSEAQAANPWAFDAGYIISDWQMGNYNSMNEAEIQAFLTRMNPCNNRDYNEYLNQTNAYGPKGYSWHWNNGHFVCLSEERFGDGMTIGSGDTAARIIWQTAQDYRINPQVLIVLLEKENGLITDTFPHNNQYRTATGFGCPDTAACDSQYFGFKNQLRQAAALFRTVLDGGWSNYPVGNIYVQYNPNAACGGTMVNIRNRATSALYRYTPYQPNASALGAGYGLGDGCGAYGNRNFYLYFEDWFGGITAESYPMPESSVIDEGVYTIKSVVNQDKVIDITSGSKNNGANVQLFTNNDSGAQKWRIENNLDGTYTLVNPQSNKALDVAAGGRTIGTNVEIYTQNKTCAQKWRITDTGGGNYTIYSTCSGMPLDLPGAATNNGTNVQLYSPNGTNAQKWKLVREVIKEDENKTTPLDDLSGNYIIQSSIDANKVIDVAGGAEIANNGTNIQLFDNNNTAAQKWKLTKNIDGTYTIVNTTANKVIDVAGGGVSNYTNIQLFTSNGTCAQKWKVSQNNDGTYTFVSGCSSLVIDLNAASIANGSNIQIFTSNNTNAQRWRLKKI